MDSMSTGTIHALKPNVTQEEAVRAFSGAGVSALYWRMRSGPLRRIADAYVPYFLFRVKYAGAPARLFAIDAVDGSLDLFEFPRIPVERELLLWRIAIGCKRLSRKTVRRKFCETRSCVSSSSKDFSSFATLGSKSLRCLANCTSPTGLVSMSALDRSAAA